MRDHRLLKLFCLISVRTALVLAIVASQLGNEYFAVVNIPTPLGDVGANCGRIPGRKSSYMLRWASPKTTFDCWVKRRSDLWGPPDKEQLIADRLGENESRRGITTYDLIPGVSYHDSASLKYMFIAHAWVIGFFAILTAAPFVNRFRGRRRLKPAREPAT